MYVNWLCLTTSGSHRLAASGPAGPQALKGRAPPRVKFPAGPGVRPPGNAEGPRNPAGEEAGSRRRLKEAAKARAVSVGSGPAPRQAERPPPVPSENSSLTAPAGAGSDRAFQRAFRSSSRGRKCREPSAPRHSPALFAVACLLAQNNPGSGVRRR